MKKCRRCTKPATLHITEIKHGEGRTLHLCEGCAQEYLTHVGAGEEIDEEAFGKPQLQLAGGTEESEGPACPDCGITFKKFRTQGRLGCPKDYEIFRDRLIPLLESIHGASQHVGKCPQHKPEVNRRHHELVRLKSELKAAVELEDYEQAAHLRDLIRGLESGDVQT